MRNLTRDDLLSLEQYAMQRNAWRTQLLAHKRTRQVGIGPNVTLYFEDRRTVQYQIQEMLRIERIFEPAEIEAELATYNPLIPDGDDWKATLMLEFTAIEERRAALNRLQQVETRVWTQVNEMARVYAIADEDLERSTTEKTSAVHFLRFTLPAAFIAAVKTGAALTFGIDHPAYTYQCQVTAVTQAALIADLDLFKQTV